jgi:VWFA-related protein
LAFSGTVAAALCLAFSFPHGSSAQETGAPSAQPLRAVTELVKLDVAAVDRHGNFAGGLEQKNFRVLDNGGEQPIAYFAPVEAPAQVLVLVETSPAVYLISNQHLFAAYALLDGLAPGDQVALATYDQAPRAILGFTSDKSAMLSALGQIHYSLGWAQLNFYDSVSSVLDWLAPLPGKRALLLLTTGLDSSPPARWDALLQKLRGEDVVIYSVALGGILRDHPGKKPPKTAPDPDSSESMSWAKADGALESLATATGGRSYFPQSPADFVSMYREIASALRHQYVLGIAPQHDGQFHSLSVQILGNGGQLLSADVKRAEYRVFARQGYLAPQ